MRRSLLAGVLCLMLVLGTASGAFASPSPVLTGAEDARELKSVAPRQEGQPSLLDDLLQPDDTTGESPRFSMTEEGDLRYWGAPASRGVPAMPAASGDPECSAVWLLMILFSTGAWSGCRDLLPSPFRLDLCEDFAHAAARTTQPSTDANQRRRLGVELSQQCFVRFVDRFRRRSGRVRVRRRWFRNASNRRR